MPHPYKKRKKERNRTKHGRVGGSSLHDDDDTSLEGLWLLLGILCVVFFFFFFFFSSSKSDKKEKRRNVCDGEKGRERIGSWFGQIEFKQQTSRDIGTGRTEALSLLHNVRTC